GIMAASMMYVFRTRLQRLGENVYTSVDFEQNLWVSKLPELKNLFRGIVQPGSSTLLKHLYIECCPSLITVFSAHLELKNLEVLKIKFCDKIEGIYGENVLGEKTLPKLKTLILLKLPELESICGGVLPSLKNLRVIGCSKIKRLPVSRKTTSPVKIKGEAVWWNDLEWDNEGTQEHSEVGDLTSVGCVTRC
ncbi:Disease resistance protein, partial [Thalictrum thalictroides]